MIEEAAPAARRTAEELSLRDRIAAELFVRMHDNPETSYAEDAEDAFIAANAFMLAREKWN